MPPQCSRTWLIEKGTSVLHFCLSYKSLMSLWRPEQWKRVFISLLPFLFPTSLCCCIQPWLHWAPQWPLTEPSSLGPACLGVPCALQRTLGPQLSWNCQVSLVAQWWLETSPPKMGHITTLVYCCAGVWYSLEKRGYMKIACMGGWQFTWGQHLRNCRRSEPTAWHGLHSMEWLGMGLARRQVQLKL